MRRNLALALPLAVLFIALGVPSNAQKGEAGDEAAEALVSVAEGAPLTVECALRVEERAEWRLDGGAVPADMRPAGEAAAPGGLTARLHAAAARAQHAGLYTCARRPAQRVRVRVLFVPGAGEQAAAPAAASAPSPAGPQDAALSLTFYDVGRTFSLNCTAPRPTDGAAYSWKKNGTAVEEVWDLRDRYKLEEGGAVFRMAVRTNEEDFGNYTCALGGEPALGWEVRGRPHAKLPHNTNVVEKQSLKITCKLIGKPYPAVAWTFSNSSEEGDNGTAVAAALGERVSVQRSEQGVEGGELLLRDAERSDAGAYTCAPAAGVPATSTLRVKDQYAALWPFLGICAEVFVLCAIILVYEKRRTKPELDDSDTDNHDQKKS